MTRTILVILLALCALTGCSGKGSPKQPQNKHRQVSLCDKHVAVSLDPLFKPVRAGAQWVGSWEGKMVQCQVGECDPSGWECPEPPPEPEPIPVYVRGPYQEAAALCEKHGGGLSTGDARWSRHSLDGRLAEVIRAQFDGKLKGLGSIHFMSDSRDTVSWVNEDGGVGVRRLPGLSHRNLRMGVHGHPLQGRRPATGQTGQDTGSPRAEGGGGKSKAGSCTGTRDSRSLGQAQG